MRRATDSVLSNCATASSTRPCASQSRPTITPTTALAKSGSNASAQPRACRALSSAASRSGEPGVFEHGECRAHERLTSPVPHPMEVLEAARQRRDDRFVRSTPVLDRVQAVFGDDPRSLAELHTGFEQAGHPHPDLAGAAPAPPERVERPCQLGDGVEVARREEVIRRSPQLVLLVEQACDALDLALPRRSRARLDGEPDIEVSVALLRLLQQASLGQPIAAVFAHRREHREPGPGPSVLLAHETAVDQAPSASMASAPSMPSAIHSIASRPKPARKTPSRRSSSRSGSDSSCALQSMVARNVRWRSGRSRAPPTSKGRRGPVGQGARRGVNTRSRAAASSMASGTLSSAPQIATTSAVFSSVSSKSGLPARARSVNS